LNKDFTSKRLGEKRVSDITHIKINSILNYLTKIIDLADRKMLPQIGGVKYAASIMRSIFSKNIKQSMYGKEFNWAICFRRGKCS